MHPLDAKKEAMKALDEADRLLDNLQYRIPDSDHELVRKIIAALHLAIARLIDC